MQTRSTSTLRRTAAVRPILALLAAAMLALGVATAQPAQTEDAPQSQGQERIQGPEERFSVPVPSGWQAEQREGYIALTSPEGGIDVYTLAVEEGDLEAAIEQAWERVSPGFDLAVDQTESPPPPEGVEEVFVVAYDTAQDRVVQAFVQGFEGTAYVLLIDADLAEAQRRISQIQIIQSGFQIAAVEETDLTGAEAAPIDSAMLDSLEAYVEDSLDVFGVPGASVAIVEGGRIVYADGFGVRDRASGAPVGPETLMMIGSTTKTMTTMLLADLVGDGALSWETPVTDILPQFEVSDPQLTQDFEVRHLVCACTGVPRRDLELVFNSAELSAEDVVRSLAGFEFFTDFGEAFQYSNQLVAVGGYAAAAAAGAEFGSLYDGYVAAMEERILHPIGMAYSTFSFERVEAHDDRATPYGIDAEFELVTLPLAAERFVEPVAPAGGLWSNAIDMGRYLVTQIQEGVGPAGLRVVPAEPLARTWEPQVSISDTASYGLGWIVQEYKGLEVLGHGGNTFGFTSSLAFLPSEDIGIVVLANRRNANGLTEAIRTRLFELLYDQPHEFDEQARFLHEQQADQLAQLREDTVDAVEEDAVRPFAGTYRSDALGEVRIELAEGGLWLDVGEFRAELLPSAEEDERDTYYMMDPPLLGERIRLVRADDGSPRPVVGAGAYEYPLEPVQGDEAP